MPSRRRGRPSAPPRRPTRPCRRSRSCSGTSTTIGATYAFSRYEPGRRERSEVDDNSIKLTWVDRALDWLTFRANYTYLRQTGDRYNYNPYAFAFSPNLPGYVAPPSAGSLPDSMSLTFAMRSFD